MEQAKAVIKNVWPYQEDKMNLPVRDLEAAIPFYETIMGFHLISRKNYHISLPLSAGTE